MVNGLDLFKRGGEEMSLRASCDPDVPYLVKIQRKRFKLLYPDMKPDGKTCVEPTAQEQLVMEA